jgi:hypothetical protein
MRDRRACAIVPDTARARQIDPAGRTSMNDIAQRAARAAATPDLWRSIPLEWAMIAAAIFLAAGLKLAGLMV